MISEREQDLRDEYLADQAWEDAQEERYWNCKHKIWSVTDEGIVDVESWKNGKKLDEPIAWIAIECDDCGRSNHLKAPYSDILRLLRQYVCHGNPMTGYDKLSIDEDGWGE